MIRRLGVAWELLGAFFHARRRLHAPLPVAVGAMRAVPPATPSHLGVPRAEARRLARAVGRVVPFEDRCLLRSLMLTRLLARRGMPSTFVIGVRRRPSFAAHAWVDYDGLELFGDGSFTRLKTL